MSPFDSCWYWKVRCFVFDKFYLSNNTFYVHVDSKLIFCRTGNSSIWRLQYLTFTSDNFYTRTFRFPNLIGYPKFRVDADGIDRRPPLTPPFLPRWTRVSNTTTWSFFKRLCSSRRICWHRSPGSLWTHSSNLKVLPADLRRHQSFPVRSSETPFFPFQW